jgi:hypothetical protein
MIIALQVLLSAAVVLAVVLPIVSKLEKWKKEMDEDE